MKIIDWQRIGWKVSDMRRSRNMTQQKLAELTGLSDVYIGYLEQGKRHGPMETYIQIVNALDYSMDDLLEEYISKTLPLSPADAKFLSTDCTLTEQEFIQCLMKITLDFFHQQRTSV